MVRKNAINKYKLSVPKHRLQRIDKTRRQLMWAIFETPLTS